jgi:DNA mismatch repair ATPase MutL
LGFRGEALSAACELSDSLAFTTRVEGEPTAAQCEVQRDGTIKSTRSIGAPVGTSVKVTGFLGKVPVRRENAKRNMVRNMQKLRVLVGTYYLARFRTRFALRVVKAKGKGTEGGDLVYPPSKTVAEAARKVVGRDVVNAGVWVSNVEERTPAQFAVEAYMLRPDSEEKTGAKGQFVYVDGRPMAGERGILKKILGLYKSALKKAWGVEKLQEPFIWLNLKCPEESYDANVEPAKDDVMFFHDAHVVEAVEEVLKEVYGELGEKSTRKAKDSENTVSGGFEVLLARKTPPSERRLQKQGHENSAEPDNTNAEDTFEIRESSSKTTAPDSTEPEVPNTLVTPQNQEPVTSQHFGNARSRDASDPPTTNYRPPREYETDGEPIALGIDIRTWQAEDKLDSGDAEEVNVVEANPQPNPPTRKHTRDWGKNTSYEIDDDEIPGADELEAFLPLDEETIGTCDGRA